MLRPARKHHSTSRTNLRTPDDNGISGKGHPYDDDATGKSKSLFPKSVKVVLVASLALIVLADQYRIQRRGGTDDGAMALLKTSAVVARTKATLSEKEPTSKPRIDPLSNARTVPKAAGFRAITAEEDEALLIDKDGKNLHVVFSTDCSRYQSWQSYLLFHSALKVKQPGRVTRIASGCSDKEQADARNWFDEHVAVMSSRFGIHFTPRFSRIERDGREVTYKYFNKPFGLEHWMKHGDGMGLDQSGNMSHEDVIVILVDPDQLLLRPILTDYSDDRETIIGKRAMKDRKFRVEHGSPFGQAYGLGVKKWMGFNLTEIAGVDSPAKAVDQPYASVHYPAGPPYIATARDMYAIAVKWVEFAPRVHAVYPALLAEMYAYSIAAAHVVLPHQLVQSLMVSSVGTGGEGWAFVDAIPRTDVCRVAANPNHTQHALPNVVHYCQKYRFADWFFYKPAWPKDFFTCDSPLVMEPPQDTVPADKSSANHLFMLCALFSALNDAAMFYKSHHCSPGNLEKKKLP